MNKKFISRLLLTGAFLISSLFSTLFAAPATPVLAASCSGTGCNGKDPIAMGCTSGGVTTPSSTGITENGKVLAIIKLKWSLQCKTYWTEISLSSLALTKYPYGTSWANEPNGAGFNTTVVTGGYKQQLVRSKMWYAPNKQVQGCGDVSYDPNHFGPSACTNFVVRW